MSSTTLIGNLSGGEPPGSNSSRDAAGAPGNRMYAARRPAGRGR